MKDYTKEIVEMMTGAGRNLAQVTASSSFEFWQRKDFRLYVNFQNITQTEQDRIFNELEVTILGLFTLHLDYALLVTAKDYKVVIQALQKEIVSGFLQLFLDTGVEQKFVKQWNMLIDMRFKEYREDYATALKESLSMKEFKGEEELRVTWVRIETMTIDCLTHIRRGKVEEKDPLGGLIRKWLITLDTSLRPFTTLGEDKQKN